MTVHAVTRRSSCKPDNPPTTCNNPATHGYVGEVWHDYDAIRDIMMQLMVMWESYDMTMAQFGTSRCHTATQCRGLGGKGIV